jgi:hypothetical protein
MHEKGKEIIFSTLTLGSGLRKTLSLTTPRDSPFFRLFPPPHAMLPLFLVVLVLAQVGWSER